jgi:hypothetical protein
VKALIPPNGINIRVNQTVPVFSVGPLPDLIINGVEKTAPFASHCAALEAVRSERRNMDYHIAFVDVFTGVLFGRYPVSERIINYLKLGSH